MRREAKICCSCIIDFISAIYFDIYFYDSFICICIFINLINIHVIWPKLAIVEYEGLQLLLYNMQNLIH